jgi:two-component system, chemotaxis family, protein-glutamate methylesterase/glutaminase
MSARVRAGGGRREIDAVAIGASAGALEALRIILAPLPRTFGAALLVVVHVPSNRDSLLVDVLARHCALPVLEPSDKQEIRDGMVYVAPPGYHLMVEPDRSFSLSLEPPVNFSRPSIDVLFESAAHAYRHRLLGIVLTGANEDGTAGLAAIRAAGGLAWVQEPDSAAAAMMPRSAIERAGADAIHSPAAMAAELAALGKP